MSGNFPASMAQSYAVPPTHVRQRVILVATLASVLLYVDRYCFAFPQNAIRDDLQLDDWQMAWVKGAFFWTYAFGQVPAGWFGDRVGPRLALAVFLAAWSMLTVACGLAHTFLLLVIARFAFGFAQAGTYPVCGALVKNWIPLDARARANSVIALGGRVGSAVAPQIMPWIMPAMASLYLPSFGQVSGWRGTFVLFGLLGLPVVWLLLRWVRTTPAEHPDCNDAERQLIRGVPALASPPIAEHAVEKLPAAVMLTNGSLWAMSIMQWTTNIGWIFVVNEFPRFLQEAYHVPEKQRGLMSGMPLWLGLTGLFVGGWLTDRGTRRFGLRWGRALPIAVSRFMAAACYIACLWIDEPWAFVGAMAMMAFMTDAGIGATWAFGQDVGGKHVGPVLGWGNMWGNLGAAVSPLLMHAAFTYWGDGNKWNGPFIVCAIAFLISGVAALGIRADRPLTTVASGGR